MAEWRVVDVTDATSFALVPPCADPRFDHRTCDYWEDAERGSKAARPSWLQAGAAPAPAPRRALQDNPFAPPPRTAPPLNPFLDAEEEDAPDDNPFVPTVRVQRGVTSGVPRKLALLDRGR